MFSTTVVSHGVGWDRASCHGPWEVPCPSPQPRPETRRRLQAYLDGLLSDTRRKNGWQLAETVGDATPYGFQHLLGRAAWSVDQARDALCAYVAEHLGDAD